MMRLKCGDLICLHKCRECGVPHDDREVKQCPADFHHRTQTRQNRPWVCGVTLRVCMCCGQLAVCVGEGRWGVL